jgi:HAT1-interacting factor 1
MSTGSPDEQKLETLKAQALKAYSLKDYTTSTSLYADACELQSTLNGEDNPKNAHLLYLYGRSLFQVALKKSDVLGGAPVEEKEPAKKKNKDKAEVKPLPSKTEGKPGLFSFTGDENWDDSDEEVEEGEEGEAEEEGEKDDDFTLAWEILDFARVLFLKQLEPPAAKEKEEEEKPKEDPVVPATTTDSSSEPITSIPNEEPAKPAIPTLTEEEKKNIRSILADIYDLLGEVSLESESFQQAVKDLQSSLALKLELYPIESTLISEAHFKLSLALEFAAAGEDVSRDDRKKGREAAAVEMEKAIESCKARIAKEEAELSGDDVKGKGKATSTKSLEEAREMVQELETRVFFFLSFLLNLRY